MLYICLKHDSNEVKYDLNHTTHNLNYGKQKINLKIIIYINFFITFIEFMNYFYIIFIYKKLYKFLLKY